jgi:hypothetical protein
MVHTNYTRCYYTLDFYPLGLYLLSQRHALSWNELGSQVEEMGEYILAVPGPPPAVNYPENTGASLFPSQRLLLKILEPIIPKPYSHQLQTLFLKSMEFVHQQRR